MTVYDALRIGATKTGRRDASLFLSHIIGCGASEIFLHGEKMLSTAEREKFFSFITRREAGEPLQYIIGVWDFFGLEFFTDSRALIPRPETELLVEYVLAGAFPPHPRRAKPAMNTGDRCKRQHIPSKPDNVSHTAGNAICAFHGSPSAKSESVPCSTEKSCEARFFEKNFLKGGSGENFFEKKFSPEKPVKILDICTGSGCIALALAFSLGDRAEITAIDISPDALALAKKNAEKLGLSSRVKFIESDLLEKISYEDDERFDIIVSNPPYITDAEMATLAPNVRDFEPHLALEGGADGLEIYRRLVPQAKNALKPGGELFLEIGPPAVADLVREAGFADVKIFNDYADLPRIIKATSENPI